MTCKSGFVPSVFCLKLWAFSPSTQTQPMPLIVLCPATALRALDRSSLALYQWPEDKYPSLRHSLHDLLFPGVLSLIGAQSTLFLIPLNEWAHQCVLDHHIFNAIYSSIAPFSSQPLLWLSFAVNTLKECIAAFTSLSYIFPTIELYLFIPSLFFF